MKKILIFVLLSLKAAYSAILFDPAGDPKQLEAYYQKCGGLAPFQSVVPSIYLKAENPQAFWTPSIVVDLFQIVNFGSLTQDRNFDTTIFLSSAVALNTEMYNVMQPYQGKWHELFGKLISKSQKCFDAEPTNKMLRKILVGKHLLKTALDLELDAFEHDQLVLWRFTTNFVADQKITQNTSFALSLLGGYVLDGYAYDWSGGFSNLSACTYAYCANSLEAKAANPEKSFDGHVLYFARIDQMYLSANLQFTGRIDHRNGKYPTLGYCPALAQVAWGRGEYFHPRLNPGTLTPEMIQKIGLDAGEVVDLEGA